jgi:hypothetical protein
MDFFTDTEFEVQPIRVILKNPNQTYYWQLNELKEDPTSENKMPYINVEFEAQLVRVTEKATQ